MLLNFTNGESFATGASRYAYRPATAGESTNRIILTVEVVGNPTEAVVDTGAPYVVLAPRIARLAGFNPAFALRRETMLIRGMRLDGSIDLLNITLLATLFGENLDVNATVFVPDAEEFWGDFPSFIGLGGFLERICFAINPSTDTFYFGSLTEP
jgi:hypothetical protein